MRTTILPALTLALILGATACGEPEPDTTGATTGTETDIDSDTTENSVSGGGTETCAPGAADCVDAVAKGETAGDAIIAPDIPLVETLQQQPRLVVATPGATDGSSPIFLQEATLVGSTLKVSFSGGHAPCFVVDTAEVVERDDAVIVNVRAGATKGTDQANCTTDVEMQYVEIEFADELRSRPLLNGSLVFQDDVQN